MPLATVLAWVQTAKDTRDTASHVCSITCPQDEALFVAREIATWGRCPQRFSPKLDSGENLASGFRSTILYASGRRRIVSPWQ